MGGGGTLANCSFNVIQIAAVSTTGDGNVNLYGCLSLLDPVCVVCLCVCVISE